MSERLFRTFKDRAFRVTALVGIAAGISACGSPSKVCEGEIFPGDGSVVTKTLSQNFDSTNKPEEVFVTMKKVEEDWGPLSRTCETNEYSDGHSQSREDIYLGLLRYRRGTDGILSGLYSGDFKIELLSGGTFILELPGNHSFVIKTGLSK